MRLRGALPDKTRLLSLRRTDGRKNEISIDKEKKTKKMKRRRNGLETAAIAAAAEEFAVAVEEDGMVLWAPHPPPAQVGVEGRTRCKIAEPFGENLGFAVGRQ